MTANNSKGLIAWEHMNAATQLMHSAYGMIWGALWESNNFSDPIGVSDRMNKLINDVGELIDDMEHGTTELFRNSLDEFHDSLDDEKPATTE